MDILGKLFGSEAKVRIMRLFLFNGELSFTNEDVAERTKTSISVTRHELTVLRQMKLVRRKSFLKRVLRKKGKASTFVSVRTQGWILDTSFAYFLELQRLLIDVSLLRGNELIRRLHTSGRLKLLITAGIFIQNSDSRVDLLVVADNLKRGALEHAIRGIESEIGKELKYAAFETTEFNYRLGMYDKLVRDILDYPHTVVLDRLGLPPLKEEGR